MTIDRVGGALAGAAAGSAAGPAAATGSSAFSQSFGRLLDAAASAEGEADGAIGRMLDGSGEVHEAMIALQQSDLMLQFTVQVRNKIVQAYQDIMRMPV